MDVLSEILRVVRLSGAIHFAARFTHPWGILSSPPDMLAARLKVPNGSVTPFHVFVEGACIVRSGALEPIRIESGDVIVFPRGDQHLMLSADGVTPVPIKDIYTPSHEITTLHHGGGGTPSHFICGFLHADQRFDPLLNSLPSLICIRSRPNAVTIETLDKSGRRFHPIDHAPEAEWWKSSLRYLVSETAARGPGNRAILARLAESLFIEMLRWQLRHATAGDTGWLAGLNDHHVGRALALIHAEPQRAWTVDDLASEVAMSRAAFAKRFADLVGTSPIHYLAGWRMQLAQHLLRDSTLGITDIALRVGYESEAAFNRAFRRHAGQPPATWRNNVAAR